MKFLAQVLLIVINIVFLIFGLCMFIIGAVLRWSDGAFRDQIDPVLRGMEDAIKNAGQGSIETTSFNLGEMLGGITIILMVVGVIIFAIAFLGCFGTGCKVRNFLALYGIIMLVVFVTELIVIIVYFADREMFVAKIKQPIVDHFKEEYAGYNATDAVSVGWNYVMLELSCCGVNDYTDLKDTKKWVLAGKNKFHDSISGAIVYLKTPFACCKMKGEFPESTDVKKSDCAWVLTTENSYFEKGCYTALEELIAANMTGAIIGSILYGLLQMLLISSAFKLYKIYGEEKRVGVLA